MLKTKTTKKKFYNKWLYKVTFFVPGARAIQYYDYDDLNDFLLTDPEDVEMPAYGMLPKAYQNKFQILKLVNVLKQFPKDSYATRIERETLDFYTNDRAVFDEVSIKFAETLKHRFEPSPSLLENSDKTGIIYSSRLAHNRYRYKVYLRPHKFNKDRDSKKSFLDWLSSQKDRVLISDSVKVWFLNTDWNWDRRYMFVEDESTLMMLKLRSEDAVGKVLEYVISDK